MSGHERCSSRTRHFGRTERLWRQGHLALVALIVTASSVLAVPAGATTAGDSGSTTTVITAAPGTTSTTPVVSTTTATAVTTTTTPAMSVSTTTAPASVPTTEAPGAPILHGTAISPHTGVTLNGTGSSFAAPAIETFVNTVMPPPYNLTINYSSTSSGDGRYEFQQGTTDIAVSDIAYGLGSTDTVPPSFPFIYVPVTAGGIAFMYNIPGLTKTLQLTSYTACAIMTGGITNWNDASIASSNPGVTLPNLAIKPVTESDAAGTNFVLEEWCIAEQPALWSAFANQENHQQGGPTGGVAISPTAPESNWPPLSNGLDTQSTAQVAGDIETNSGSVGAVQVKYATDDGFGGSDPTKGVASVENASGDYTQPTPVDVASALAYATQLPNGTHQLDFSGAGPHVYNPSTYSYLLTPTQGWQSSKGAVLSSFINYVLTLGQQKSPSIGYASLGLSLEQYGIKSVTADVPGAVAVTSAEAAAYACGDLTPTEVAAGQTTPTCGVTNVTAPVPPASGAAGTSGGSGGASSTSGSTAASSTASHESSTSTSGSSGGSGAGVDPGVSLTGSTPLAFTGGNPLPEAAVGAGLLAAGWVARRRMLRGRRTQKVP